MPSIIKILGGCPSRQKIWAGSTNLIINITGQPDDISLGGTGNWSTSNCTCSGYMSGPPGWPLMQNLAKNTAASGVAYFQNITTSNQSYTACALIRGGDDPWVALSFGNGAPTDGAFFDVSNGKIGTIAASTTATMRRIIGAYYWCTITRTLAGAGGDYIQIEPHTADNQGSFAGSLGLNFWIGATLFKVGAAP